MTWHLYVWRDWSKYEAPSNSTPFEQYPIPIKWEPKFKMRYEAAN